MAIIRKVEVDVTPTVKELAEEIWNLSTTEQIQLLKCLDDCFYQDSMQGDNQLASVCNALNDDSEENEIIEKAKHFLCKINDFLITESVGLKILHSAIKDNESLIRDKVINAIKDYDFGNSEDLKYRIQDVFAEILEEKIFHNKES